MFPGAKRLLAGGLLALLFLVSCDSGEQVRQYTEESPASPMTRTTGEVPGASGDIRNQRSGKLLWDTPIGWREEQKPSTMRLASFTIKDDRGEAICTVIPLKGDGGGLKLNVIRWLDQLNIKLSSESEVDSFIGRQQRFNTSGGLPAVFVDFTALSPSTDTGTSILVGIVTLEGATVYVKMTGDASLLKTRKDRFLSLLKSLKIGS